MGMTDERLQEISKEYSKLISDRDAYEWDMFASDTIPELIAAVEASFIAIDAAILFMEKAEKGRGEAQAELDKEKSRLDYPHEEIADLRRRLAVCKSNLSLSLDDNMETQLKLESSNEKLVDVFAENSICRKQLAESVTKRNKVSKECDVLRQELGEARAKIERLELTEYGSFDK